MSYDDCLVLVAAFRDAVRIEKALNGNSSLEPLAKGIVDKLEHAIAVMLAEGKKPDEVEF